MSLRWGGGVGPVCRPDTWDACSHTQRSGSQRSAPLQTPGLRAWWAVGTVPCVLSSRSIYSANSWGHPGPKERRSAI